MPAIEEIASSRARLTIASLISSRPRTLGELAEVTGISVQGVLKHLRKLEAEGILKEWNMPTGRYLRPRKLYYIDSRKVADFSQDNLLIAALGRTVDQEQIQDVGTYDELDRLAQDIIIQERRAKEISKRMMRMIEDVLDSESRIGMLIDSMSMAPDEKQIAYLIFGEDGPERARMILKKHYGCTDPDSAIRSITQKIKRARSR